MDWHYFPFCRSLINADQTAGHMWKEQHGWILAVKRDGRWKILDREPMPNVCDAMKILQVEVLRGVFL